METDTSHDIWMYEMFGDRENRGGKNDNKKCTRI